MTTKQLKSIKLTDLQRAVIKQLGYRSLTEECFIDLENVAHAGAAAGFGGFTYYADTVKFAKKNMGQILSLIAQHTREGLEPLHTLRTDDETQMLNWYAWYALESTAWDITNQVENMEA